MKCQWAACSERHATLEDGYWHCAMHLKWHRALEAGKDAPPSPMPRDYLPCGTPAAARRHQRRGEPTCTACRIAAHEYNERRKKVRS